MRLTFNSVILMLPCAHIHIHTVPLSPHLSSCSFTLAGHTPCYPLIFPPPSPPPSPSNSGVPGVKPERFAEGMEPKHCALSLVGEPIMYPEINTLAQLLHQKGISTFLVTNAQFPEAIKYVHTAVFDYMVDYWRVHTLSCLSVFASHGPRLSSSPVINTLCYYCNYRVNSVRVGVSMRMKLNVN